MSIEHINSRNALPSVLQKVEHSHPFVEKIKTASAILKENLSFPVRYLGAKTWSIPGIIVRTPVLLFKRIFFHEPLTKREFFGAGYHFSNGPQLSAEETKEMLRYAAFGLVPFRYEQDKWAEPFGAKIVPPANLTVDLTKIPGNVQTNSHAFIDKDNLFKAMVIEDENEMVVTFGAMHSHWHDNLGESEAKKYVNRQLKSVFGNYIGKSYLYYQQADALTEQLKKIAQKKNKRLVVTGQSLSGAMASYVSLKQQVKGVCFNAVQLGAGLQREIGDQKLAKADGFLTQVSVSNELVSQFPGISVVDRILSGAGVRTPGNFGRRFRVPTAFGMRKAHDYPIQSMMKHIGYQIDTKANEIKPEDIRRSK